MSPREPNKAYGTIHTPNHSTDRLTRARPARVIGKPGSPKPVKAPPKPAFKTNDLAHAAAAAEGIIKEAAVTKVPMRTTIHSLTARIVTGGPDVAVHFKANLQRVNLTPQARHLLELFADQVIAARKKK